MPHICAKKENENEKKKERTKKKIRNSPFRPHRQLSPKTEAVPTTESHDRSIPKREDKANKEKNQEWLVSERKRKEKKTKSKKKNGKK